ncbi:MAG: hypothetical protein WA973_05970 [Mesorhizobium sp.]|jgi:hypothetical protein|uniref:hypothetical protein n=1 Tax=Aquamicrobium zhengzhouense TaxID=2781738 RepID=UPI001AED3AB8|nr:hypothetical protein [Aquamicrobium zhengzhouense]
MANGFHLEGNEIGVIADGSFRCGSRSQCEPARKRQSAAIDGKKARLRLGTGPSR